ncbi:hydroxymethylglutaryl-CoA lyase [Niabella terrae]
METPVTDHSPDNRVLSRPISMPVMHVTECPRDGQQGLDYIIPPPQRARYINELMTAGFDIIDFGSFVSPKAVPQMAGSAAVLEAIDKTISPTRLLAIVGNLRGAAEAAAQEKLDIIGYPYSVSETFLRKNINADAQEAFRILQDIQEAADSGSKALRVYISMALGNPYGDPWSEDLVADQVGLLLANGIRQITIADTVGSGSAAEIGSLLKKLLPAFPQAEIGLHLHSLNGDAYAKIEAAWQAGCRHFDGVINGWGGCPMTGFELLGNINTLEILRFCDEHQILSHVDPDKVRELADRYGNFRGLATAT